MRFATVFFLLTVFGFKGFSQMNVNPADSIFADLEKDFVFVEGGTFMSTSATTNPESHKIHKEKVSDFYIARYKVTVGLYEKVTGKIRLPRATKTARLKTFQATTAWIFATREKILRTSGAATAGFSGSETNKTIVIFHNHVLHRICALLLQFSYHHRLNTRQHNSS